MNSLGVRVLQLWALIFVTDTLRAEEIDWLYEISKSARVITQEYDDRLTHKLIRDNMAPDFVVIMPLFTLEGDFEALEKQWTNLEHRGNYIRGPPQVVMTCENTALIWRNVTFYDKECNRKDGTQVIFYQYIDDMLKTKLFHSTVG